MEKTNLIKLLTNEGLYCLMYAGHMIKSSSDLVHGNVYVGSN